MIESRCGILCDECEYREKAGCNGCMNIEKPFWGDWLDAYLRSLPSVIRDFKEEWQWIRYQVGDKMFAAICRDATGERDIITIKLDVMDGEFLRQQYKDIIPGHYMNKVHWNSIYLDGEVPTDIIKELIEKSYYLVVAGLSKKKQKEILGEGR